MKYVVVGTHRAEKWKYLLGGSTESWKRYEFEIHQSGNSR